MTDYRKYWNEERETMDPAVRDQRILERIKHQLDYVYEHLPFYRRHYDAAGFHPSQVNTLEDFTRKVPIITKKDLVADQAEHPPFGSYLGVDESKLQRIHGSSGTTGTPTMYGVSKHDWESGKEVSCMALWAAGVRPHNVVQISFPFTLFFGGWGLLQACEELGACAFPVGTVVPTDRQIELMVRLEVDVLVATPSYLLHLASRAAELGVSPEDTNVKIAIVAGEPGGSIPANRKAMSDAWNGAKIIDLGAGSTSEMYPFTANTGCIDQEGGVHLYQDENYTEVVSKDDPYEPVPAGTSGATVATHLWRDSQPMIRFWTGDEGLLDDTPCPCGRTYPRLPHGVYGRLDDMLLIRGANVYPSAIDAAIRDFDDVGAEYRIIVERPGDLDQMRVEVERGTDVTDVDDLTNRLEEAITASAMVRTPVKVVEPGTFEVQTFKARRVLDLR